MSLILYPSEWTVQGSLQLVWKHTAKRGKNCCWNCSPSTYFNTVPDITHHPQYGSWRLLKLMWTAPPSFHSCQTKVANLDGHVFCHDLSQKNVCVKLRNTAAYGTRVNWTQGTYWTGFVGLHHLCMAKTYHTIWRSHTDCTGKIWHSVR